MGPPPSAAVCPRVKQFYLESSRLSVGKGEPVMKDWLEKTQDLTLKGQIAVPYSWWVGETGSRFLMAIRDEKKILGSRCSKCGQVFAPPRKNCGRCFVDIDDWVELSDEGTVTAFTKVHFEHALQPVEPPYAYAVIKLDGADVGLVHLVKDNLDKLRNGCRVKAVFREERTGHILDIDCFQVVGPDAEG